MASQPAVVVSTECETSAQPENLYYDEPYSDYPGDNSCPDMDIPENHEPDIISIETETATPLSTEDVKQFFNLKKFKIGNILMSTVSHQAYIVSGLSKNFVTLKMQSTDGKIHTIRKRIIRNLYGYEWVNLSRNAKTGEYDSVYGVFHFCEAKPLDEKTSAFASGMVHSFKMLYGYDTFSIIARKENTIVYHRYSAFDFQNDTPDYEAIILNDELGEYFCPTMATKTASRIYAKDFLSTTQPDALYDDDSFSDAPGDNSCPDMDIPGEYVPDDNPGFTVIPSEHITRPDYTAYPDTIQDDIPCVTVHACDIPAHNPATAVVPYNQAAGIRKFFHIIALYIRLWLAINITPKNERHEAWQYHSCQYCENDPRPDWTHEQFALGIILGNEYSEYARKNRYCTMSMSEWLRKKYSLVQLYKIYHSLGYQLLLGDNTSTQKAACIISTAIADTVINMEHFYVCTYEVVNYSAYRGWSFLILRGLRYNLKG